MLSAAKKGLLVLVSALVAIFAIYELMLTEVIFDQAMTACYQATSGKSNLVRLPQDDGFDRADGL